MVRQRLGRESGVMLALGPPPESHSPPGSSSVSHPLGRSSVVTEERSVSRLWGNRATRGHGVGSQASPPSREAPLQAMAGPGPWPERPSLPLPTPCQALSYASPAAHLHEGSGSRQPYRGGRGSGTSGDPPSQRQSSGGARPGPGPLAAPPPGSAVSRDTPAPMWPHPQSPTVAEPWL